MRWLRYLRKIGKVISLVDDMLEVAESGIETLSDKKVSDQELAMLRNKLQLIVNKIKTF